MHPVPEGKSKHNPTPKSREKICHKQSVQNGTRLCPQCCVAAKSQNNQSIQNESGCDVWARLSTNVGVSSSTNSTLDGLMRMKIATWEQKQIQMASCTTYEELESIVRRINRDHHFEIPDNIHHTKTSFEIDYTAQHFYPQGVP